MIGGRKVFVVVGLVVLLIGGVVMLRDEPEELEKEELKDEAPEVRVGAPELVGVKPPPEGLREDLSSDYLTGYGDPAKSPMEDLALVENLIDGFLYTIKVPDALPAGENREVVAAMLGDNPYLIRFVDPANPFINEEGELTDRWKTPLFFHFVGADEVGIRSAGPDGKMWTGDDVVIAE